MRQLTPNSPRESERFRRSGASRAFRATGLVPRVGSTAAALRLDAVENFRAYHQAVRAKRHVF
jgi:hypothetical protein